MNNLISAIIGFLGGILGGAITWKIAQRETGIRLLEKKLDALKTGIEQLDIFKKKLIESAAADLRVTGKVEKGTIGEVVRPVADLFFEIEKYGVDFDWPDTNGQFYFEYISPLAACLGSAYATTRELEYVRDFFDRKYPLTDDEKRELEEMEKESLPYRKKFLKTLRREYEKMGKLDKFYESMEKEKYDERNAFDDAQVLINHFRNILEHNRDLIITLLHNPNEQK
jgi:hypothetical protein